jgi:hypothetical protein
MRRNQRKSTVLATDGNVSIKLNDGEHTHDPHVHAVRGRNDWRIYLRTDEWEPKTGDFNGNERRAIKRLYEAHKNLGVARWNRKYPENKV